MTCRGADIDLSVPQEADYTNTNLRNMGAAVWTVHGYFKEIGWPWWCHCLMYAFQARWAVANLQLIASRVGGRASWFNGTREGTDVKLELFGAARQLNWEWLSNVLLIAMSFFETKPRGNCEPLARSGRHRSA
ncbi:unnamed protein product [Boreogadus saida]